MVTNKDDGWPKWSNKVLGDLKEHRAKYEKLSDQIVDIRLELAVLKTKATIYGGTAGLVFSAILTFIVKHLI